MSMHLLITSKRVLIVETRLKNEWKEFRSRQCIPLTFLCDEETNVGKGLGVLCLVVLPTLSPHDPVPTVVTNHPWKVQRGDRSSDRIPSVTHSTLLITHLQYPSVRTPTLTRSIRDKEEGLGVKPTLIDPQPRSKVFVSTFIGSERGSRGVESDSPFRTTV